MAKQKKKSTFFEKMNRDKGRDWIKSANPAEIQRDAKMLFRDMAFGSIDKSLYGYAFADYQFWINIYNAAYEIWQEETLLYNGLLALSDTNPIISTNSAYILALQKHYKIISAYTRICEVLNAIWREQKLEWLDVLAADLKSVRFYI